MSEVVRPVSACNFGEALELPVGLWFALQGVGRSIKMAEVENGLTVQLKTNFPIFLRGTSCASFSCSSYGFLQRLRLGRSSNRRRRLSVVARVLTLRGDSPRQKSTSPKRSNSFPPIHEAIICVDSFSFSRAILPRHASTWRKGPGSNCEVGTPVPRSIEVWQRCKGHRE